MNKKSKIYVAGHGGLVGSAIVNSLKAKGYSNITVQSHSELDLKDQLEVKKFFEREKPDYVFLAAAKVGGIKANNDFRGDFIYDNLCIQNNVIGQSLEHRVKKLLFLGSTCIYPKEVEQPMNEDSLLTSSLEFTNEPYAIAKIAGIKLCESFNLQYKTNFISVMPTNLYGLNDNFNLETSHVLPALMRKIYLAKLLRTNNFEEILRDLGLKHRDQISEYLATFGVTKNSVEIWGSGKPKREFMNVKDMADACIFIMENVNFSDLVNYKRKNNKLSLINSDGIEEIRNTHINIGTGEDISIIDLAKKIKKIIGYDGELIFNSLMPDGTMRKLTDVSLLNSLGWRHKVDLDQGISELYNWYRGN